MFAFRGEAVAPLGLNFVYGAQDPPNTANAWVLQKTRSARCNFPAARPIIGQRQIEEI
jgi:hypothetical protein